MAANDVTIRLSLQGVASVVNGLNSVSSVLTKLRTIIAGAVVTKLAFDLQRLTKQAIDTADAAGKMAQKVGIGVEQLTALQYAAKLADISNEELKVGIKSLSEEMVKAGEATRGVDEKILELADEFARTADGAGKTARAVELFGRNGLAMIPFLNQGSAALREQMQEARDLGLVVGPAFAENADRFNDNLTRIDSVLKGVFLRVAENLLPVIIELQERFLDFAKNVEQREALIAGLSEIIKRMALFAAGLAQAFQQVAIWMAAASNPKFFVPFANAAIMGEAMEESAESFRRFQGLVQTLDRIGEEQADTQERQNKALREFTVLATRAQTLRFNISASESAIKQLGKSPFTSGREQRAGEAEELRGQLAALSALQADIQSRMPREQFGSDSQGRMLMTQEAIRANGELNQVLEQQAEVRTRLQEIDAQDTFSGRMMANLQTLSEEWGNLSRNMADVLTNSVGTAVQGVSDAIYGAITGTMTWGQVFAQVAKSIIKNIINMVVQWIASMLVITVLKKALGAEDKLAAGASAVAWAPAAIAASIASYGGAAVAGLAGYATALASGIALTAGASAASSAGFAKGGFTGDGGVNDIAGIVHKREFVFSAPAVDRLGLDTLEALHAGMSPASMEAPSVNVGGPAITNVTVPDMAAAREFLKSRAGRKEIINIVREERRAIGIQA